MAILKVAGKPQAEAPTWTLGDLLRPDTIVASFPSGREAEAAITAAMAISHAPSRIRYFSGPSAGRELRNQWRNRSLLRRVLGVSDELRLIDEVTRRLDGGETIVVFHGGNVPGLLPALAQASFIVRVARWSFDFIQ